MKASWPIDCLLWGDIGIRAYQRGLGMAGTVPLARKILPHAGLSTVLSLASDARYTRLYN